VKEASGEDFSGTDFLTFTDLDQSVRDDVTAIRALGAKLPSDGKVSGHVYDVTTGELRQVVAP
jgi:carbonic anhydrase